MLALGVFADLVSMLLLAFSNLVRASPHIAFAILLVATGALGFGFGSTVMALNTYAESLFPERADRAVLVLNALLGAGSALAPLFVAVLLGHESGGYCRPWWRVSWR